MAKILFLFSLFGEIIAMIEKAGVAGAGAMGAGIAQVFALANIGVVLFDISPLQLEKAATEIENNLSAAVSRGKIKEADKAGALSRITFSSEAGSLKAGLVVEAIAESLEPKRQLFQKLAEINPAETILATNTSSLSVTGIAKGITNPERIAGLHFFNPAHIMKLVEVISGAETSPETAETLRQLCISIGKTPIMCKDSPGFIVNRVARPFYLESLKLLEEKVASAETIDALMESAGFKMGPFKLMDHVGNDINFAVTSSVYESFNQEPRFRPSRIQQQKVDAGHFGKKTGKGFYKYE